MKMAIMVIVIFKVRTRARLKKPLEERRNLSGKSAHLAYQSLLELLLNNKHKLLKLEDLRIK